MTNPYGPWATAIDAGPNPQLSAFWRQRLAMLVPASRTSPTLSGRSLACLFAAAAIIIALPTFRVAGAVAKEEKMASENSRVHQGENTAAESSAVESGDETPSGGSIFITTFSGSAKSSSYLVLPISVSYALGRENGRKDLKITGDQEKKLREISEEYLKQHGESRQRISKEMEKLSAEERVTRQREFQAKSAQEAKSVRVQVEKLLTAEQWTAVKGIGMGLAGVGLSASDPQFREKIGVTGQQKKSCPGSSSRQESGRNGTPRRGRKTKKSR